MGGLTRVTSRGERFRVAFDQSSGSAVPRASPASRERRASGGRGGCSVGGGSRRTPASRQATRARAAPPLYGNHSDPRRWRINTGTAAAVAPWGAWRRWCWITAPTTPRSATATRTSGEAARQRRRRPFVSDRSPLIPAWTSQPLAFPAARSRRPASAAAVGAAPAARPGHASSAFLRRRGRCEPRADGLQSDLLPWAGCHAPARTAQRPVQSGPERLQEWSTCSPIGSLRLISVATAIFSQSPVLINSLRTRRGCKYIIENTLL